MHREWFCVNRSEGSGHRPGRARIQCEPQANPPVGAGQFGPDNDEPLPWVERETHRTMAVSAGILPVNSTA